jgi:hypothetical protein
MPREMMVEETSGEAHVSELRPWTQPEVRWMRAGDAENGFEPVVGDGQFTKS